MVANLGHITAIDKIFDCENKTKYFLLLRKTKKYIFCSDMSLMRHHNDVTNVTLYVRSEFSGR